jgi:hypothetical protein
MLRRARLDAPGTVHPVMGRGIAGIRAFPTKRDRADFLLRVAKRHEALAFYAWAIMDTHFPVVLRTGRDTLSGQHAEGSHRLRGE